MITETYSRLESEPLFLLEFAVNTNPKEIGENLLSAGIPEAGEAPKEVLAAFKNAIPSLSEGDLLMILNVPPLHDDQSAFDVMKARFNEVAASAKDGAPDFTFSALWPETVKGLKDAHEKVGAAKEEAKVQTAKPCCCQEKKRKMQNLLLVIGLVISIILIAKNW
jgi:hypothetical protein